MKKDKIYHFTSLFFLKLMFFQEKSVFLANNCGQTNGETFSANRPHPFLTKTLNTMSDFEDIIKQMRESLSQMAEEAQGKYNELREYLDSHDSEEIKSDLKEMAKKATEEAREELGKAKEQLEEVDIKEKIEAARETLEEGMGKAKEKVEELRSDYREGKMDERIAEARETIGEGMEKATQLVNEGLETVQKQWEELRKRLNI